MKWGFMLEVSVGLAMPPDLLARPAQLLSAEGGAPELQLLHDLCLNPKRADPWPQNTLESWGRGVPAPFRCLWSGIPPSLTRHPPTGHRPHIS